MEWLILVLGFFFSFNFTILIVRYLELRRNRIKKRVDEIEHKDWQEKDVTSNTKQKKSDSRLSIALWNILGNIKLFRILEERLQNELKKANILMKSRELIILIFISGLLGSTLGIIISGGSIKRGIWLGFFTWLLPLNWVKVKKNKRKEKLSTQLTDMLSMIANSLKAGYSLIQSLELLSREMAPPMAEEIQRMLQEMRLGVTTEQALINFNERVESNDLDLIITAMLIQRQVGGNLAEILDSIGETIRERIRIQGEIKALTAQGRMSMIIFMILPIGLAVFLFMSNPEYMSVLITDPIGWVLLGIAIGGQILGAIFIRRIIRIEV